MSDLKSLIKFKDLCEDEYYYNGNKLVPDEEFDTITDLLEDLKISNVKNIPLKPGKVKLPIPMWSLTKIKNFSIPKNSGKKFILMDKLDGVSCLIYNGKAYTRGDGEYGFEITNLIKNIVNIKGYAIRGELVVKKTNKLEEYANTRTMVCSFVNRNVYSELIDFVAYECISLEGEDLNIYDQLKLLKNHKINVVYFEGPFEIEEKKANIFLEQRLVNCEYDIDGIVLGFCEMQRNAKELLRNPKYALAYKKNILGIETTVKDIIWNISKSQKYIPTIIINPINISGSIIKKISGHNLNYLQKKGIGINSIIQVIKSGNIIPHVSNVLKRSENYNYPEDTKINSKNHDCLVKKLIFFSKTLKIQGMGPVKAKELISEGITPYNLITCGLINLKEKFNEGKTNKKLINSIEVRLNECSLEELLTALSFFGDGVGISKIKKMDVYNNEKVIKFIKIFNKNYNRKFSIEEIINKKELLCCISGSRDKKIEEYITTLGYKPTYSFTKKTHMLYIVGVPKSNTKLNKAIEMNIDIKYHKI